MLDRDLATIYVVKLYAINQVARRNISSFPSDFIFQLTEDEWDILRSQFVIANMNISKVRFFPYTFTEHGVLILSNVPNSEKAITMSIEIIQVFNKLRKYTLKQTSAGVLFDELHRLLIFHIENNDYKFSEHDEENREIF
jgi:hypothetical protein